MLFSLFHPNETLKVFLANPSFWLSAKTFRVYFVI